MGGDKYDNKNKTKKKYNTVQLLFLFQFQPSRGTTRSAAHL